MRQGQFRSLVIAPDLLLLAAKNYPNSLKPLLDEIVTNAHGPPAFYTSSKEGDLLKRYAMRNRVPAHKPRLAVLCAGIGCDALAALAAHYQIVALIDACPHACKELSLIFLS